MMKLFVWEDVLCDYSCGMIICIAEDIETARDAWYAEFEKWMKMPIITQYKMEVASEPIIYDLNIPCDPICHFVTGGG
jgi:hypothetical protein